MISLVNATRRDHGLSALQRSPRLDRGAGAHGRDMAEPDYFAHVSLSGRTPASRLQEVGYRPCAAAENIGHGPAFSTPAAMMSAWMGSRGHQANLLNRRVMEVGYARVADPDGSHDPIWVMVFGRPGC